MSKAITEFYAASSATVFTADVVEELVNCCDCADVIGEILEDYRRMMEIGE